MRLVRRAISYALVRRGEEAMTVKKPSSAFRAWFEAQYGKEPYPNVTLASMIGDEESAHVALDKARYVREMRELYEVRRDAALKAWLAGKEKP